MQAVDAKKNTTFVGLQIIRLFCGYANEKPWPAVEVLRRLSGTS
jgi:hypothetical protein